MPHIFAHMKQVSYSDLHNKGAYKSFQDKCSDWNHCW